MPGERWTRSEKDKLRQAVELGCNVRDIDINSRRTNAIRTQAIRMGLIQPNAARVTWPLRQRRLLKKYWRLGLKPDQIHDNNLLGDPYRSLWSIKKKWGRMKLADRRRARKMRRKKVWQPGEKEQFEQYLLEKSSTMTPEEIANVWHVARSTVARWQAELGIKQPRQVVMQMDYSLAKQRRAARRIRRNNVLSADERRARQETALLEKAAELRTRYRHLNERVCTDCERSWPVRAAFFHWTDRRTDFGTSRYFKHRCRLCQNALRRAQARLRRSRRRPQPLPSRAA